MTLLTSAVLGESRHALTPATGDCDTLDSVVEGEEEFMDEENEEQEDEDPSKNVREGIGEVKFLFSLS